MSQCVPSWDLDGDNHRLSNVDSHSNTTPPLLTTLDYEVAELTWTNGQLAMNSLGQPRVLMKPFTATPKWNVNPLATGGTLESIVHQATTSLHTDGKVVPWLENHRAAAVAAAAKGGDMSTVLSIDALVPSTNQPQCVADSSTHVGSCSRGAATPNKKGDGLARNRGRVARVERALRVPSIGTQDWSSRDLSASVSETFEQNDSRRMTTVDTFDRDYALGFTSTSAGSPENSSSGVPCKTSTGDEHDSVCHSRRQRQIGNEDENKKGNRKSSVSTKRSRAAAIHNQSERKRRDKINQRMKTLQKMVPNSSKIDKASMLDEVIEYLKQLQAQVTMMSRMNMTPAMMLPLAMQQQVQMSMMAPMMSMGMGMGMGMGMDMNTMAAARHTMSGIPPVLHPNSFMPGLPSWDAPGSDRVPAVTMPDPLSTFVACQSQPMTMDAYSKMAALYQQMNQPHG